MRKQLLVTYIVVIMITSLIGLAFSWVAVKRVVYDGAKDDLNNKMNYLVRILELEEKGKQGKTEDLVDFANRYRVAEKIRITMMTLDGEVVADSEKDPTGMDNHIYRAEIKKLLQQEPAFSIRYSNTMKSYTCYLAQLVQANDQDYILRIATPVHNMERLILELVESMAIGIVVGILLASVIAYFFTRSFLKPIEELTVVATEVAAGDYDKKVYLDRNEQLRCLSKAFNKMTFSMSKAMWTVESKNAELEAILTGMSIGMIAVDESFKILFYNRAFAHILELEEPFSVDYLFELTRHTCIIQTIEKAIERDEFIQREDVIQLNGNLKVLGISAMPIRNKNNNVLKQGVLVNLEDNTNLRRLETIRKDFVSNVTHELKTPLTSIKGFVEILRNDGMKQEPMARRALEIIEIEVDRLVDLINDILSLSEIESMKVDKNIEDISIRELIEEVLKLLQDKIQTKQLAIKLEVQTDLPTIESNRNRLKQLLINLIDNSIKYTEAGYVRISAGLSKDERHLLLEIEDTGIGIEAEHLERIFERFYRVDKGRSQKVGGTGLGLSIVKHIVELYQGEISIKSRLDQGTKIRLKLPLQR